MRQINNNHLSDAKTIDLCWQLNTTLLYADNIASYYPHLIGVPFLVHSNKILWFSFFLKASQCNVVIANSSISRNPKSSEKCLFVLTFSPPRETATPPKKPPEAFLCTNKHQNPPEKQDYNNNSNNCSSSKKGESQDSHLEIGRWILKQQQ